MRKLVAKRGLLKCKLFIFITILNVVNISLFAQAPDWSWAKGINGDVRSVISDGFDYIYATGYFYGTITLGDTTLISTGYPADTTADILIVKYDTSGNVIWAKSGGGNYTDWSNSIVIDNNQNIYITGWVTSQTITFDTITITSVGTSNIFIAKYDSSGNAIWVKLAEGDGATSNNSTGITIDLNNNIYITGRFSNSLTFDSTIISTGHIFIAKYNTFGNLIWVKSNNGSQANDIAVDTYSNVYITGSFADSLIILGNDTLINLNDGFYDLFIAKYNSEGNIIWAKSAGGYYSDESNSIAIDNVGDIIITGGFYSTIYFDSYPLFYTTGGNDVFITKYNSDGNVLWAKSIGGNEGHENGRNISIDNDNNIFVTGEFNGSSIYFDNDTLQNVNTNESDLFIAKFDAIGNELWAKSTGSNYNDYGFCVSSDNFGNVYHVGLLFGEPSIFGNDTINYSGSFIAKLNNTITSINELENKNSLLIYPNPTTTYLNIELPTDFLTSNQNTITIFDIFGKQLIKQQINSEKSTINTNIFPSGVYIIRVSNEKISSEKRFVKM